MTKKLSVSIAVTEEIRDKMDNEAREMGISRSAVLTVAFNEYLRNKEILNRMKDVPGILKQLEGLKN